MTERTEHDEMRVHQGRALVSAADTYQSLTAVLVEAVQNALDENARHVAIAVDLKRRHALVMDDGDGVGLEHFRRALTSIFQSIKDSTKLGKFGRGLVSPITKCERYTFASQPKGEPAYEWTFELEQIESQSDNLLIPRRKLGNLPNYNPFGDELGAVEWRTVVQLHGLKRDRAISTVRFEELEEQIGFKLGPKMLALGASCLVVQISENGHSERREIRPHEYTGEPFPLVTIPFGAAGDVIFELYRAPKGPRGARGQVSFAEMDGQYPLPYREFALQAQRRQLFDVSEVFTALGSGHFEGLIRAQNVKLDPGRKQFIIGEPLDDLYGALEEWYVSYGRAYFRQEKEKQQERRYQGLALAALDRVRKELLTPSHAAMLDAIRERGGLGNIGAGHAANKKDAQTSETQPSSVRAGGGKKDTSTDQTRPSRPRSEPKADHPKDAPLSATGPSGKPRKVVRNDSLGLQISHDWLPNSNRLWEFDAERGIIWFNTRSPDWKRCDQEDRHVILVETWILIQVIALLPEPPDQFESLRRVVDNQTSLYIDILILRPQRHKS